MSRQIGPLQTTTIVLLVALVCVTGAVSLNAADVKFTTIPPAGAYETVGIVSTVAQIGAGFMDASKPFKEAMKGAYPDLSQQAQVRGADAVVITSVQILVDSSSKWLLIYGTAIRTGGGLPSSAGVGSAPGMMSQAAGGSTTGQETDTAQDLAGTWAGTVLEEGETKPVGITVNIMSASDPGTYKGGILLDDPGCEVTMESVGKEGDRFQFKGLQTSKFRCIKIGAFTGQLRSDGRLDWKIFKSTAFASPTFQGVLTRH